MAKLFINQSKQYVEARPSYPQELFGYVVSKTTGHDLAWDAGTGSGQAAQSLAEIFKNVVATDTSQKQIDFAPKLPNIRYEQTSPVMSMAEVEQKLAPKSTIDLVTVAQALHWFDLPSFYQQVKHVLKKPNGVIAAWCYTIPRVNNIFDPVFDRFYTIDSNTYWDPARKLVDDKYKTIDFPFEPVDGEENTGPFEFVTERVMDLDGFLTYIRSWSAYQTAKEKGVELLRDDVVEAFREAWNVGGNDAHRAVKFPVNLRIGKVGN